MIKLPKHKKPYFPRFLIILSIPLFLYCTLLIGFLNIIPLKTEIHSIIIIGFILFIFLIFIKHNAWYSFAKFSNSLEDTVKEIENYLVQNEMEIANKKKAYGNIEPFYEKQLRNIRNDNYASIAASIFPTLGILGTFVAIAISMPDFSVESQADLDKEITILLSGVGTAFYASIFGIFLSLWWVFFEKKGLSKIQNIMDEIKINFDDKVWKKEEIEVLTLVQNKLQNDKLLLKLENTINPQFIQTLNDVAHSKINLIEKLNSEHLEFETKLLGRYNNIIEAFDKNSLKQEHLLNNYEKLHELMAKMNTGTSNSLEEHNRFIKALKSEIYNVLSSFELISGDLKSLGRNLLDKNFEESYKDERKQ
jgi:flagellar motor component MotA